LRRLRDNRTTLRNIRADNGTGPDFHIVADPNIPDNDRSGSDKAAVTDHRGFPIHFSNRHILINPALFSDHGIAGYENAMQPMRERGDVLKDRIRADIPSVAVCQTAHKEGEDVPEKQVLCGLLPTIKPPKPCEAVSP
jgi:hypothetical protein